MHSHQGMHFLQTVKKGTDRRKEKGKGFVSFFKK